MMATGYKLRDVHAQRVQVELDLGGRCVTVSGLAEYDNGELRIAVEDPAGDFALVLNDEHWKGDITDAPDGNSVLIRLGGATRQ
jgi:prophage tail gpP-like protein